MKFTGSVKIQLFDAVTGKETDRVESHNLITNASNLIFNGCPYALDRRQASGYAAGAQPTDWSNIYRQVFGGILVFPNNLAESANHLYEPLAHYPVAYGSMNGQDTYDTKTATFNGNDSGNITDADNNVIGYSYVYDLGTSQGNGQWNAVALTSALAGEGYARYSAKLFNTSMQRTAANNYVCVGMVKDYVLFAYNGKIYGLRTSPYKFPMVQQTSGTPVELLSSYSGSIFCDYENDKFYTLSGTSSLTLTEYDMSDLANPTTTTISPSSAIPQGYAYTFVIRNGAIYVGYNGATTYTASVFKIDISSGTVTTITVTGLSDYRSARPLGLTAAGDVYAFTDIIDSNDEVHHLEDVDSSAFNASQGVPFATFGVWSGIGTIVRYNYGAMLNNNYLGTIFNLTNTVTKDASKTAKITYKLKKTVV